MRRGAIGSGLAALLAAAACAPAAVAPEDASLDAESCFGRIDDPRGGRGTLVSYPPGDCGELGPSAVIEGVWYRGFEEMRFAENATSAPARRVFRLRDLRSRHLVELWITRAERERVVDDDPRLGTRAILIRFVGRKGRVQPSGNHGGTLQVVAVDRLLTARLLAVTEDYIDCRDFAPEQRWDTPCAPGTESAVR